MSVVYGDDKKAKSKSRSLHKPYHSVRTTLGNVNEFLRPKSA